MRCTYIRYELPPGFLDRRERGNVFVHQGEIECLLVVPSGLDFVPWYSFTLQRQYEWISSSLGAEKC